jgi:2-methylaconitate cis-trans-isomerase PrpF
VTGSLFPTGRRQDVIDGITVTCIDACMPLLIMHAADFGVRGNEPSIELDKVPGLLERMAAIRLKAGAMMGLGDVSASVVPKPILISGLADPATITSRYFTPHRCHTSHAVTGAIGLATAYTLPGTIASESFPARVTGNHAIAVLHPQGRIDVQIELAVVDGEIAVHSGSVVRTARKIMEGALHLPQY